MSNEEIAAPAGCSHRRFLIGFFVLNLFLSSYFLDVWTTPNSVSRALPVLTLFEERTLKINTYRGKTGDRSRLGEDYYSDKAPLPTFLMVPFYGMIRAAGLDAVDERTTGKQFPIHIWKSVRPDIDGRTVQFTKLYPLLLMSSFLCGSVPFAWMLLAACRALLRRNAALPVVVLVMMAFYGSHLFVFSGTFFNHILSGALLLASWISLRKERYLLSGFLLGLGFLSEYPVGIALPVWLVLIYVQRRDLKKAARFVSGALPALAGIAVYNYLIAGNPFKMLNAYHAGSVFGEQLSRAYGFGLNNLGSESLWGLSFSPYMGVFIFVPVLLVLLVETARWTAAEPGRVSALVRNHATVLGMVYFLLIASFFTWWGGWSYGPRYLIPPACLLIYEGVIFLSGRRFSRTFFLVATSFGVGSAWLAKATLMYMIPDNTTPDGSAPAEGLGPIFDRLLPELWAGRFNNGSLPSIALGVPPNVAVFLWPLLFTGSVWILTRWHSRLMTD